MNDMDYDTLTDEDLMEMMSPDQWGLGREKVHRTLHCDTGMGSFITFHIKLTGFSADFEGWRSAYIEELAPTVTELEKRGLLKADGPYDR